jgi:hypothetical protein
MVKLYRQAIEKERDEKLALLAAHYKVDAADCRSLVLALACDMIPGFQVEPNLFEIRGDPGDSYLVEFPGSKEGRPAEWPPERLARLIVDVDRTKKDRRLSRDREALAYLAARHKEWAPPPRSSGWAKTLQNRLAQARFIERGADRWRSVIKELKVKS